MLRSVARIAAPMVGRVVGTAIGGPVGTMIGGQLGNLASRALREGEFEAEYEAGSAAEAELMAAAASQTRSEAEAEAMIGAAAIASLSRRDRAVLRRLLPNLTRGVAVLTRLLRQRRATRPAIRTIPTIVRRTARSLVRQAQTGRPVTLRTAARTMAAQTRRVIGSPSVCAATITRNVRATASAANAARRRTPGTRN